MEQHALAILQQNDIWNWWRKQGSGFQVITPNFLYLLIVESQKLGGKVLDHFWKNVGTCDAKLEENIKSLKVEDFVSAQKSCEVLFRGLDPTNINFEPILTMAVEFFTHLGVAFMNPVELESGTSTAFSVSEIVNEDTNKLLQWLNKEGDFGERDQGLLKALLFKRDGTSCLLTGRKFRPFNSIGIHPTLMHIIPNYVCGMPETLKYIAMLANAATTYDVVCHLQGISNTMNMQLPTHTLYNKLEWGIEAKGEGEEIKYFFRTIPTPTNLDTCAPGIITLKEGDEIHFGKGPEGKRLGNGPIPGLCNLQLAIARVLKMSGAADIILQWKGLADNDQYPASEECMLDNKFFSGKLEELKL